MCNCPKNAKFGNYGSEESRKYRNVVCTPQGRRQEIDNCVLPELKILWSQGIKTIESCCGHNKSNGYIAVADESIQQMQTLGYVEETRKNLFYPKSTPITNKFNHYQNKSMK